MSLMILASTSSIPNLYEYACFFWQYSNKDHRPAVVELDPKSFYDK